MTMTEPNRVATFNDADLVPTPAQQAMAEQRLAEMLANPSICMTEEEFDDFLDNLEI